MKYKIITFGCQMNKCDSERIAAVLEKANYRPVDKLELADLIVINMCSVRQSAVDRVWGLLQKYEVGSKKYEKAKPKIILTGCILDADRKKFKNRVDLITNIKNFLEGSDPLKHKPCHRFWRVGPFCSDSGGSDPQEPRYSSKFSAYVPISNGCNNFCSYCVVPYVRGPERYRPADDILKEVKSLIQKGYKEIILLGQNVNSYRVKGSDLECKNMDLFSGIAGTKSDLKCKDMDEVRPFQRYGQDKVGPFRQQRGQSSFPKLLEMINDIPGDFWIRFTSPHPKDTSQELIEAVAKLSKVCEHIHLPVQSGDNQILKKMNRNYRVEEYKKLISQIRKMEKIREERGIKGRIRDKKGRSLPVSISTDIIVGFPGESWEQFANTAKLMRWAKFDMAYIAQYSPRPGTGAAKLDDNVPKEEKKHREKKLTEILKKTALENNKKYIGKTIEVLIRGKDRRGNIQARTRTFKNVRIVADPGYRMQDASIGKFAKVKVSGASIWGLEGIRRD